MQILHFKMYLPGKIQIPCNTLGYCMGSESSLESLLGNPQKMQTSDLRLNPSVSVSLFICIRTAKEGGKIKVKKGLQGAYLCKYRSVQNSNNNKFMYYCGYVICHLIYSLFKSQDFVVSIFSHEIMQVMRHMPLIKRVRDIYKRVILSLIRNRGREYIYIYISKHISQFHE